MEADSKLFKNITYKNEFSENHQINQELFNLKLELYDQGYIGARFDSIHEVGDTTNAYLTIDKRYELACLGRGNMDE